MKNETNTQHTPAPWSITGLEIRKDSGVPIIIAKVCHSVLNQSVAEVTANAQLIVRAPELLKENEQLKEQLETGANQYAKAVADLEPLQAINAELLEALKEIAKMDNKDFANSFHPAGKAAEQIQFIGKMAKAAIAKAETKTLVGS